MNHWADILTSEQLAARYALTDSLDLAFTRDAQVFWQTRTAPQLRALQSGAWYANQGEQYQMARTYLASLAPIQPEKESAQ